MSELPIYEVYGVKYAHHERTARENFLGSDAHDGPMPLDYLRYPCMGDMRKMRDELGTTFVFSTHDPKIMAEAEIIYHLEDGQVKNRETVRGAAHA